MTGLYLLMNAKPNKVVASAERRVWFFCGVNLLAAVFLFPFADEYRQHVGKRVVGFSSSSHRARLADTTRG